MLHIVNGEQFLERHTSDTSYGIQTGQCQCGNAHGHKALCYIYRDAKHFQESCNTGGEDLERGSGCCGTICCSCRTGNTQSQDSQQA